MNEEIEILKELGFNISTRGFMYWIYAIEEHKNKITIDKIYDVIAARERTSKQNVEGAMKYCRMGCDKKIKNKFNYKGKLTNNIILNLLTYYIKEV